MKQTTAIDVHRLLDNLARRGFYGSLTVRTQDGRVAHVIEERSDRPDAASLPDYSEDFHARPR
jgi:hypothetical protein